MKCTCCNNNLNDWESTAKNATSGEYLDMCRKCLKGLQIPVDPRKDLDPDEEVWDDELFGDLEEEE